MTKEEKWFNRLHRCIDAMPKNIEVAVSNGIIVLLPKGAVDRAFEEHGDVDYFDEEAIDSFTCTKVITCSESL